MESKHTELEMVSTEKAQSKNDASENVRKDIKKNTRSLSTGRQSLAMGDLAQELFEKKDDNIDPDESKKIIKKSILSSLGLVAGMLLMGAMKWGLVVQQSTYYCEVTEPSSFEIHKTNCKSLLVLNKSGDYNPQLSENLYVSDIVWHVWVVFGCQCAYMVVIWAIFSVTTFFRAKRSLFENKPKARLPCQVLFFTFLGVGVNGAEIATNMGSTMTPQMILLIAYVYVYSGMKISYCIISAGSICVQTFLTAGIFFLFLENVYENHTSSDVLSQAILLFGFAVGMLLPLIYLKIKRSDTEEVTTKLVKSMQDIASEQKFYTLLLNNVLPPSITKEITESGLTSADQYDSCSIMFAYVVGVDKHSTNPEENYRYIFELVCRFDELCAKYGVEKIKTIGDDYMAASGLPIAAPDHAERMGTLAIAIVNTIKQYNQDFASESDYELGWRIGIASGKVVAGVIGKTKFTFDVFGDTVNTASRMMSHCPDNQIMVTKETAALMMKSMDLKLMQHPKGSIKVKGKGFMEPMILTVPTYTRNFDKQVHQNSVLLLESGVVESDSLDAPHVRKPSIRRSHTTLLPQQNAFSTESDQEERSSSILSLGLIHDKQMIDLTSRKRFYSPYASSRFSCGKIDDDKLHLHYLNKSFMEKNFLESRGTIQLWWLVYLLFLIVGLEAVTISAFHNEKTFAYFRPSTFVYVNETCGSFSCASVVSGIGQFLILPTLIAYILFLTPVNKYKKTANTNGYYDQIDTVNKKMTNSSTDTEPKKEGEKQKNPIYDFQRKGYIAVSWIALTIIVSGHLVQVNI